MLGASPDHPPSVWARVEPPAASGIVRSMTTAIRGATVVDGTGADPRPDDVYFAGDRIVEPTSPTDETIDGERHFVLPGLIEAHTHLGIIEFADTKGRPLIPQRIPSVPGRERHVRRAAV